MQFAEISVGEAHNLVRSSDSSLKILDLRSAEEYGISHVDTAINVDFYDSSFIDELNSLEKNISYILYTDNKYSSDMTLEVMIALGFRNAYYMSGGFLGWKNKKYPITRSIRKAS